MTALRGSAAFPATHWSLVLRAGRSEEARSAEALEQLCRSYWYPLYAYVRRSGFSPEDAQDLTQGFLEKLLARDDLVSVAPGKGRFRTFLLTSMTYYLANHRRACRREKRGGKHTHFSLDGLPAEQRFSLEPATEESPERFYDRNWAWEILGTARQKLRNEYSRAGKEDVYLLLDPFLVGGRDASLREQVATNLGVTTGAIDVALHRLRRRYGEIVRDEIMQTVSDPGAVEAELQHLIAALSCS